jgi:hypothetical protein
MRLGQVRPGRGDLLEQARHHRLVRITGKDLGELQQQFAGARASQLQFAAETLGQLVHPAAGEQQGGFHLPRLFGLRLQFEPQAHSLQRLLVLLGIKSHFGGPSHDARVARGFRQVEIKPGSQRQLAALAGDFGEQELIENLPAQLLLRQVPVRRGCFGLLRQRRNHGGRGRRDVLRQGGASGENEQQRCETSGGKDQRGRHGGKIHGRVTWRSILYNAAMLAVSPAPLAAPTFTAHA